MHRSTASCAFAQAQTDTDLPEDIHELSAVDIIKGSDPFDNLTPADFFWSKPRASLEDNMSMNAILMKWELGSVDARDAFLAMDVNGLINWELLLFMIATQHRVSTIIEGDA